MLCLCQSLFYLAKTPNSQVVKSEKTYSTLQLSLKNVLATLVPPTGIFPSVKALPGPHCSPFSVLFNNSQVFSCRGSSKQRPLNNQTFILLTVAYYQRRMSQSTKFTYSFEVPLLVYFPKVILSQHTLENSHGTPLI